MCVFIFRVCIEHSLAVLSLPCRTWKHRKLWVYCATNLGAGVLLFI